MSTELETVLARLRALYRAEFRTETRTYTRIDMATEDRVVTRIKASKKDGNLRDLQIIANDWDAIVEQEWSIADNAAARGYCPFHVTVRTTSRDGKYDAPCGACEEEMYEAEMAEEAAAVAATEPVVD